MRSATATGMVRYRRPILGVDMGLAVVCPWIGLRLSRPSSAGGFAVSAAVGFVVIMLPPLLMLALSVLALAGPRPGRFVVDPATPAFRTQPNARQVYRGIAAILGGSFPTSMALNQAQLDEARGYPEPPFLIGMTTVMIVFAVLTVLLGSITVWRGGPAVELRSDCLIARSPLGTMTVPWDALAPGYPQWRGLSDSSLALSFARPDLVRRRGLLIPSRRISAEDVDSRFLSVAIGYYVAYPQLRAEIGTQAGHDRLMWALTGRPPTYLVSQADAGR